MIKRKTFWDIKVTRTLLNKKESELTDLEKEAVKFHNENMARINAESDRMNREIRENCKILCSGREKELIPAAGWMYCVSDMAYALEKLNYFYKPYHMKVVFDQTKEKFGNFRGYWSIVHIPHGIKGAVSKFFNRLGYMDYTSRQAFHMEQIVDQEGTVTLEWEEIDEDDYENHLDRYGNKAKKYEIYKSDLMISPRQIYLASAEYPADTIYFRKDNHGYFRSYWLTHARKCHFEPTKHKLLYRLKKWCESIGIWLGDSESLNREDLVMSNAFHGEVKKIVDECEHICGDYCEVCGAHIGEHGFDQKCETAGWISYVCSKCAQARGGKYYNTRTKKWYDELEEIEDPFKKQRRKNKGK